LIHFYKRGCYEENNPVDLDVKTPTITQLF